MSSLAFGDILVVGDERWMVLGIPEAAFSHSDAPGWREVSIGEIHFQPNTVVAMRIESRHPEEPWCNLGFIDGYHRETAERWKKED